MTGGTARAPEAATADPASAGRGVVLESVTKRYGAGAAALDVARLHVPEGSFTVLVGPSGCGKSTALRIVAGLDRPTRGRVLIDGADVTTAAPGDRGVAMVFQDYALYPHMTVEGNVGFGLRLRAKHARGSGSGRAEIARRVAEVCASLGLDELRGRRPAQLSGGERQRVGLARAIVGRPSVLLLDEPLSALDAQLRHQARAELIRLHRELGNTVVFVTHDQLEALSLATWLMVMSRGRVAQAGTPEQIFDDPDDVFVATFVGSPPMNMTTATVTDGGAGLAAPGLRVRLPAPLDDAPARVTLGWRPGDGTITATTDATPPGLVLAGTVDVGEFTADGTVVHCAGESGRWTVVARTRASTPEVGQRLRVHVAPDRLRLFHPESGARLRPSGEQA